MPSKPALRNLPKIAKNKFSKIPASGPLRCVQTYGTKILKAARERKGYEDEQEY